MSDFVELRVRPVTRYVVTRYARDGETRLSSSGVMGEYPNPEQADAMALCMKAQEPMARVVTSEGTIHDPEVSIHAIIGQTLGEIQAPVFYASGPEDLERTIKRFEEAFPGVQHSVYTLNRAAYPMA